MARTPYLPTPQGLNAEFYDRAQDGVLHLQQCSDCGVIRHPPRRPQRSRQRGESSQFPGNPGPCQQPATPSS